MRKSDRGLWHKCLIEFSENIKGDEFSETIKETVRQWEEDAKRLSMWPEPPLTDWFSVPLDTEKTKKKQRKNREEQAENRQETEFSKT